MHAVASTSSDDAKRVDIMLGESCKLQAAAARRALVGDRAVAGLGRVMAALGIAVVDDHDLFFGQGAHRDRVLLERFDPVFTAIGACIRVAILGRSEMGVARVRHANAIELAGVADARLGLVEVLGVVLRQRIDRERLDVEVGQLGIEIHHVRHAPETSMRRAGIPLAATRSMTEAHVLDSTVASGRLWLHELMAKLELPEEDAGRGLHALRAGLHAIRDRLPAAEVVDLGAQLPALIRGIYYEGWRLGNDPSRIHNREDLLDRVGRELQQDKRFAPIAVLKAVIEILKEHVSEGEIADVVSTLPRSIAELWKAETHAGG